MKTQLLLKFKPVRGNTLDVVNAISGQFLPTNSQLLFPPNAENDFTFRYFDNSNWINDINYVQIRGADQRLLNIDLYEDAEIPLNYTILDVREPEKRKTNFSKTIRLPGTKNNNKIFNHVYEISGNSKFNPNLRTEVIILKDGVQVMRGNLQLKNIIRFSNGHVEYEVIVTGDFTSLFADIGIAKLSDLNFSEYNHNWTKQNIVNSWNGNIIKNGQAYNNYTIGPVRNFNNITRDATTGRIRIQTTTAHGFADGDWVRIDPTQAFGRQFVYGEWQVQRINSNTFTVNHPYPDGLFSFTLSGTVRKYQPKGEGYVYPMVSTGEDTISTAPVLGQLSTPIFPVTSFVMGFYVKEIWDKIFKQTNSRYQSNFLNSDFFKRLIVYQKKTSYDLQKSEIEGREFKVANVNGPVLRVAGFGTNNAGTRTTGGFLTTNGKYTFPANISTSGGLLYNGVPGSTPYDFSTNSWKVTDSGKYSFEFNATFRLDASISNYTVNNVFDPPGTASNVFYYWGGLPTDAYNEDVELIVKLVKISNGLVTVMNQETISLTTTNGTLNSPTKVTFKDWQFPEKQVQLVVNEQFLQKDDTIIVEVFYNSKFNNDINGTFTEAVLNPGVPGGQQQSGPRWIRTAYRGIVDIKTIGVQFFSNKANPNIIEGSEVFTEQFLPKDMSCKDFLLSIIRMFNLHIEADKEVEKFYYIEPRDEYYKNGSGGVSDYVDWTNIVDITTMDIVPMGELNAKFYNFNYKDDNDYWNKKYREDTGIGYGNYIKEIENDFLSNEQKISVNFSPSPMINSPADTNIVIPQIVQKDANGNKPTNSGPRILIWGGPRPMIDKGTAKFWWLQRSIGPTNLLSVLPDLIQYYPYAGTVDSPFDPQQDINWYYTQYVYWNRARWTNENLYNKYWSGFIQEIADPDSKLIKAFVKLSAKDINNLDFKKIYIVNGHYLRLQKIIDYNANGEGLTRCEFLKLKSPSKFKRRTLGIDEDTINSNDFYNLQGLIIVRNNTDIPPQNYSDRYPISNWAQSELSGVFNANINGQNNILSTNTVNVSIQGNENYVGANTTNVTINGSGVFVAGGLKNVSVIGTDKVFVEESDVTYINGVRYVNGVAISRANVIDGGLNIVSPKSSANTVSNVLDAGEDVVINFGSSTYENTINAGQDRILPDVSEYGVTTENSPFPTTNFVGNVVTETISTDTTLPELIVQRIDPVPYSAFNSFAS